MGSRAVARHGWTGGHPIGFPEALAHACIGAMKHQPCFLQSDRLVIGVDLRRQQTPPSLGRSDWAGTELFLPVTRGIRHVEQGEIRAWLRTIVVEARALSLYLQLLWQFDEVAHIPEAKPLDVSESLNF